MTGLDDRHRDKDGRILQKHGNTKIKNLKSNYPELKHYPTTATLDDILAVTGAKSLSNLRKRGQR